MKKCLILLMSLLLIAITSSSVCAKEQSNIEIIMVGNGISVEYLASDVNPIIENNSTLVPIRALAEQLGFTVKWNANSQTVTLRKANNRLELKIGSETAIANSIPVRLPTEPKIVNGRTFIPLRYVAEFFHKHVAWLKSIDSNLYIWISDYELLKDTDLDVQSDPNYYVLPDFPTPYYALKDDGITSRGIKIGDTYKKVVEKYGQPHRKELEKMGNMRVTYITTCFPNSEVSMLYIHITNNLVDSVEIDHI